MFWRELFEQWTPPQWCGEGPRVGDLGDALGTSRFRGESFAERCTEATSVVGPHSDGFRCPIRVAFVVALCISSGKLPVEGGATLGGGELCQDPRCRFVAVFVNIVAHRSFSVRINRARSGHVAECLPTKVGAFWASWSDCLPMM